MNTTFKNETSHATSGSPRSATIPAIWQIDPAASHVAFTTSKRVFFVKELAVTGRFTDVRGAITLDEGTPANARAAVTIGAASVGTNQGKRDAHLRKADFFDVKRYPTLTFQSRRIETINPSKGQYRVTGDLTIRGVTREIVLDGAYSPPRYGTHTPQIGVTLTTSLNRRDFGIVWNLPIMQVADEIPVTIAVVVTRT
jgi:polyisoprenoid-binding protein YceI